MSHSTTAAAVPRNGTACGVRFQFANVGGIHYSNAATHLCEAHSLTGGDGAHHQLLFHLNADDPCSNTALGCLQAQFTVADPDTPMSVYVYALGSVCVGNRNALRAIMFNPGHSFGYQYDIKWSIQCHLLQC